MAAIALILHYILTVSLAKTEKAFMNLKCDGTGTLLFDGATVPITGSKDFDYPEQITLTKDDTYNSKHSNEYNVDMPYAVGPIEQDVYIHAGNLQTSAGCPHLTMKDAMKFYKFVRQSDEVQLVTYMAYRSYPTLCRVTDIITNIFEFKWFAKEGNYGDNMEDLNVDNAESVMYDNQISMNHLNTENYEQTSPLMFMINVISVVCICSLLGIIAGVAFGCVSKVNSE